MAFLSSAARRHLRALTFTPARSIASARPALPKPPPARRILQPAPSSVPSVSTTPASATAATAASRRPTDHQIPFTHVYLIDRDTRARTGPHALAALLASARAHTPRRIVELVASAPHPTVRLTTRSEVEARLRAMRRVEAAAARAGAAPKEVQLTWGVAPADVAHKMRKARKDLEKGYRVAVSVAMKRWKRPYSQEELHAFADEIVESLAGVGEECKEREITQRLMVLTFRKVDEDVSIRSECN